MAVLTYDYVKTRTGNVSENRTYARVMNQKQYELKDHLGNVRVTFSDRKEPQDCDNLGDGWVATATSVNNYYSFGMLQPGRNWNAENYRFGFNGKENDNEVKGDGNSVDFGARIYDPRLGRWMSTDPLFRDYPDVSPYCFGENSPIWLYDSDGRKIIINYLDEEGCPQSYEYNSGIAPPDNEFVKETLFAIQQLSNTAQGDELVSFVSDSEFAIDINETTDEYGDRFRPSDNYNSGLLMPKRGETQSGSGGTIYWNPQSTTSGEDINGSTYCPAFISLGHEFVHGVQAILAEYNALPSDISPDLFQREYIACHFENVLRSENGVALRVFYFQNGEGPQLIDCDGTQNGSEYNYYEDETNTNDGKIIE